MQPDPHLNPDDANPDSADSNRSRGADGQPVRDDRTTTPPAHTHQADKDAAEQRKHPASENALPSTQDKNPIPPGSTRSAGG